MRPAFTLVHRYAGLVMAIFLAIAGLTGTALAWYHELDAAINPSVLQVTPPHPGAAALDAAVLREKVRQQLPSADVFYLDLQHEEGAARRFLVQGARDPVTGSEAVLDYDEVFLDPYTGRVTGTRMWGELAEGRINLLPFIYRLHYTLALGETGTLIFGIVALIWTVDCFVGAYLTFPARAARSQPGQRSWAAKWWTSWKIRYQGGVYKLNFDIHRATGLWIWALLFVLAWSAVGFNLKQVYSPVMQTLFKHQDQEAAIGKLARPLETPPIGYADALQRARSLMREEASAKGFHVLAERSLNYNAGKGVYRYRVYSDRDLAARIANTAIYIDATSGARRAGFLPRGEAAGDTVSTWLFALHMGTVWGLPYRIFISLSGMLVATLSITGVIVWWRKAAARRAQARRQASVPAAPQMLAGR